jgi:hypothetical protein
VVIHISLFYKLGCDALPIRAPPRWPHLVTPCSASPLSAQRSKAPQMSCWPGGRTVRVQASRCAAGVDLHGVAVRSGLPMTLDPAGVVLLIVSPSHRSSSERSRGATYALADLAFIANLAHLNFRTTCTHLSSCLSYRPSFLVISLLLLYQPHSFA